MTRQPAKCGTYSGYRTHHARGTAPCADCRDAMRAYDAARRAKRKPRLVPPDEARQRVRDWMKAGATIVGITEKTGIPKATLQGVLYTDGKITSHTHEWVMSTPAPPATGRYIDATGTHRRLRALQRLGWSLRHQSRTLGHSRTWATHVLQSPTVHVDTAAAVAAMYDELSMSIGPSRWTASRAEREGYLPPLAWDDDAIDDPWHYEFTDNSNSDDPDPDEVVVQRLVEGADWRKVGASRDERVAAAAILDARYIREAARLSAADLHNPNIDRFKRSDIERHLGLRAGRDFGFASESGETIAS